MRIAWEPEAKRRYDQYIRARKTYLAYSSLTDRGLAHLDQSHKTELYEKVLDKLKSALEFPQCRKMYVMYLPEVAVIAMRRNIEVRQARMTKHMREMSPSEAVGLQMEINALKRRISEAEKTKTLDQRLINNLALGDLVEQQKQLLLAEEAEQRAKKERKMKARLWAKDPENNSA